MKARLTVLLLLSGFIVAIISVISLSTPLQMVRAVPGAASPGGAPVRFDPVADAYISEAAPTTNFGDAAKLDVQNLDGGEFPDDRRAYVGFDLSAIPAEAIITGAAFKAFLYDTQGLNVAPIQLRRVTSSWTNNTVTWDNKPLSKPYTEINMDSQPGWKGWDVTSLVQDYWINRKFSTAPNFGLELMGPESGAYFLRSFHSADAKSDWPYLIVSYELPTPTPVPTPTPSGDLPDLIVMDVWNQNGQICYQIMNAGKAVAIKGHETALIIDGKPTALDLIDLELTPGERLNRCFAFGWKCAAFENSINICADEKNAIAEADENNNCTEETWRCDTTAPSIITGPTVSQITEKSALISWTTDEDSDGIVKYDQQAGEYGNQLSDFKLKRDHSIAVTALSPATTYHYLVQSTDASGNTVASAEGFFETKATAGGAMPKIAYLGAMNRNLPPEFLAEMAGDAEVDRVEFLRNGAHVETDYSAPFHFSLNPAYLAPDYTVMNRDSYFRDHIIQARARTSNGMMTLATLDFLAPFTCDPPAEFFYVSPYDGYLVSTDGAVAEPGTTLYIEVEASVTEWEEVLLTAASRALGQAVYGIQGTAVDRMEFWVDATQVYSSTADLTTHRLWWDASGVSLGDHPVVVKAYFQDGCVYSETHTFQVVRPRPEIVVTREVSAEDNYFDITVTITNEAEDINEGATIDDFAYLSLDYGLQVIDKNTDHASVTSRYSTRDNASEVVISVEPGFRLWADESLSITYQAVPILYPGSANYGPGEVSAGISYRDAYGNPYYDSFILPSEEGAHFADIVDDATSTSDYLLVTNPYNLLGLFDEAEANGVLNKMAELATLQNGVLGYFNGYHTLVTSFENGDPLALIGGHLFGSAATDEIILGDLSADLIRVYDAKKELFIETGSQLPIAHTLHSGDVIAVGNANDQDSAGDAHDRVEIVVADGGTGRITVYQYNYMPLSGEFEAFEFSSRYRPHTGDAFAVGNVLLMGSHYWEEEILVADACDNPSACVGEIDFHRHLSGTPSETHRVRFRTGDSLAVGRLLASDKERIIIAHVDGDTIDVYDRVSSETFLQLEYSIAHALAAEDIVTVGDVWGDAREEIILADEDEDRILIYSHDPGPDRFDLVSELSYFIQPEDSLTVADVFAGGFEEIIITRGRTSGAHHQGDAEILSMNYGASPGDGHTLDALINESGDWAGRMAASWTSEGYLLLVGETEIIPAFSFSWDLAGSDAGNVDFSDRNYASTSGNENYPELSIGRIVGDSAEQLQISLQSSIDVLRGDKEFDNSHAYATSGSNRGPSGDSDDVDFTEGRDSVADTLSGEGFSVTEQHTPSVTEFFSHDANTDVIFMAGHGNWNVWDVVSASDVDGRFSPGRARPLVYAKSCLTGRYARGHSLAEAFLDRGAAIYIGATENGISPWSTRMAENYFSWFEPGQTVGSAHKHAKIHRMGVNTWSWDPAFNRYHCAIFHLYGDPKLEPTWLSSASSQQQAAAAGARHTEALAGPIKTVDVTIPDYVVSE